MKILIIEDENLYSHILELVCTDHGAHHTVTVVDTLAKADVAVSDFKPDVVISDKDLPDGVSIGRFRSIREQKPDAIICLLTGDPAEVKDHGADYFFRKTQLHVEQLKALLTEIESRQKAKQEAKQE